MLHRISATIPLIIKNKIYHNCLKNNNLKESFKLISGVLLRLLILIFFMVQNSFGQMVFEPEFKSSYNFLSRMAQRGIINLDDVVLPLTRKYIQEKLEETYFNFRNLTPLEKKELSFYLQDYLLDRIVLDSMHQGTQAPVLFKKNKNDRWRAIAFRNKDFSFNIQPIIGSQIDLIKNQTVFKRSSGFWLYGYIRKNFGYSFSFNEVAESGTFVDYRKTFSPEPGFFGNAGVGKTNYSDFRTNMSYNWKWGTISTGREKTQWGYGAYGKLVLSNKAPAYPFVRLDVKPVSWLSFNMTAMWLSSGVIDSSSIRPTSVPKQLQVDFVPKYMSTHSITFIPSKKLSISIGESIIFNNRLKLGYVIPLSFWRAQSHYDGENGIGGSNTLSNSQFFLQFSTRNILPNTHTYFSFFVDEMRFKSFLNKNLMRNQTGYTAGFCLTNIPFKNGYFQTDYTRTRPFNYVHFIPSQTYSNGQFGLGHWIGPNADQWYTAYTYQFIRGLKTQISFNSVRAGSVGDGMGQQNEIGSKFLWGNIKRYQTLSSQINYEIVHDVFLNAQIGRTQSLKSNVLKAENKFMVGLNVGI